MVNVEIHSFWKWFPSKHHLKWNLKKFDFALYLKTKFSSWGNGTNKAQNFSLLPTSQCQWSLLQTIAVLLNVMITYFSWLGSGFYWVVYWHHDTRLIAMTHCCVASTSHLSLIKGLKSTNEISKWIRYILLKKWKQSARWPLNPWLHCWVFELTHRLMARFWSTLHKNIAVH